MWGHCGGCFGVALGVVLAVEVLAPHHPGVGPGSHAVFHLSPSVQLLIENRGGRCNWRPVIG